ncbi:MAG TPA: DUF169 domain-containing protein [Acidimicrobiales bacterium]|nr:DUF169 domain-containing protein [Acidimicrobiales bacterium]
MTLPSWGALAERLTSALHLAVAPVAISFSDEPPPRVAPFDDPMSEPTADGRTGRVPAGCVFWIRGATSTFTTVPADHGNCSVGRVTHGLATLGEVAGNADVATLLESGWVTAAEAAGLPVVSGHPGAITYGPLAATPPGVRPDVVLLRVNGRQLMVLSDAIPGLVIGGKPQCHIVAIAKEQRLTAASVGCALSRVRTGLAPEEMTCALPAADLDELVGAVERAAATDAGVARYAATDARRFPD